MTKKNKREALQDFEYGSCSPLITEWHGAVQLATHIQQVSQKVYL